MLVLGSVLFAALVWWFATGLVLALGRRPEDWHGTLLLTLAVPAALSVLAIVATAEIASAAAALTAFLSAVILWGWFEASFLFGHLTGPRRAPCPPGLSDARRFRLAFQALRDHELATVGVLLGLLALLWNAPNTIALQTFATLWTCRLAAKLCIFRGVPSLAHEMLPARLAYLKSYFGRAEPGVLYGAIVGALGAVVGVLALRVALADAPFEIVGGTLVASLAALALLEHVMMIVPLRDSRLWDWAARNMAVDADRPISTSEVANGGRRLRGVALGARAVVPTRRNA